MTLRKFADRFFLVSLILLPILFHYSSGISTITIGELLMLVAAMLMIIFHIQSIRISFPMLFLVGLIVFQMLLFFSVRGGFDSKIFGTTLRYCFYLVILIFVPTVSKELNFAISFYKKSAIFAAIFLFLQVIVYRLFSYYLSGVILSLQLSDSSLYTYSNVIHAAEVKRFMSFFGEPTHYATYQLPVLIFILFESEQIKVKNVLLALFILASIVLSTSITGMLVAAGIFVIWFFVYFISTKKVKVSTVLFVLASLSIAAIVFVRMDGISYLTNKTILQRQGDGRFEGFGYIFNELSKSSFESFFGHAMYDPGKIVFLAGIPRAIFYYGILGAVFYFIGLSCLYEKNNKQNIMIFVAMVVLSIGTEMLFGTFGLLYCACLILLKAKTKQKQKTQVTITKN